MIVTLLCLCWVVALVLSGMGAGYLWGIVPWMLVITGISSIIYFQYHFKAPKSNTGVLLATSSDEKYRERFILGWSFCPTEGVSEELAAKANRGFMSHNDPLKLPTSIKTSLLRAIYSSTLLLAVVLATGFLFPDLSPKAFQLLLVRSDETQKVSYKIDVVPGDAEVLSGDDLLIKARLSPQLTPDAKPILCKKSSDDVKRELMTVSGADGYTYTLTDIRKPFEYWVQMGDSQSKHYQVEILARPLIKLLSWTITLPEYLGGTQLTLPNDQADFSAPLGSKLTLSVETTPPATTVGLMFNEADAPGLTFEKQESSWVGTIHFDKAMEYQITWQSKGMDFTDQHWHKIGVEIDNSPIVQAISPGRDITLDDEQTISLVVMARDDHLVDSLSMVWMHPLTGDKVRINLGGGSAQLESQYQWNLKEQDLLPGEYLEYYFEAVDNDTVSGPKHSITPVYCIRIPDLNESIEAASKNLQERVITLEEVKNQGERIQEKLDSASKAAQNPPPTSVNQSGNKQAKEILQQQKDMMNKLNNATSELKKNLDQLNRNQYLTPELAEKLAEVRRLSQEIQTPEMRELLEKLQKSLENLDEEDVRKALEEMKNFSAEMQDSIERTLELLRQVQIEQKLEELVKQAEKALEQQKEVTKSLENKNESPTEQSNKQRITQQEAEKLLDDLKKMVESLKENDQTTAESLDTAGKNAQDMQMLENMEKVQNKLSSGDREGAEEMSSTAQASMEQLAQDIKNAADARRMRERNNTLRTLDEAFQELLSSSQAQSQMKDMEGQTASDRQQAIGNGLKRTAGKLSDASKRSFMINPGLAQTAREIANDALTMSQSGNGNAPGEHKSNQQQMLARINQLAKDVLDAKASVSGSKSASGYSELLENLKAMAEAQEKMGQKMGQGSPMPMPDLLGMAAQQMGIRKGMEELATRYSDMEETANNLNGIAESMRQLEEEMRSGGDPARLQNMQQNIYEKMLQTERSIRTKGLSKRRKAEPAKYYPSAAPPQLPAGEEIPRRSSAEIPSSSEKIPTVYSSWLDAYYRKLNSD